MAHVGTRPGAGILTRHHEALLWIPMDDGPTSPDARAIDELVASFLECFGTVSDADPARTVDPSRATTFVADGNIAFVLIDWSALSSPGEGTWPDGSPLRVMVAGAASVYFDAGSPAQVAATEGQVVDAIVDIGNLDRIATTVFTPVDQAHDELTSPRTGLTGGTVRSGGFTLELATHPPSSAARRTPFGSTTADVAPPSIDEVSGLDETIAPDDVISWPDESGTVDEPPGARSADDHHDDQAPDDQAPDDATQRRPPRRTPAALAAVLLPNGDTIAITEPLVIGRAPDVAAAQVEGKHRMITLDARTEVSRTHAVIEQRANRVVVIDCASTGRTAVMGADGADPVALAPWTPTPVAVGDTVLLGGPTALRIVRPPRPSAPEADDDATLLPVASPSSTPPASPSSTPPASPSSTPPASPSRGNTST